MVIAVSTDRIWNACTVPEVGPLTGVEGKLLEGEKVGFGDGAELEVGAYEAVGVPVIDRIRLLNVSAMRIAPEASRATEQGLNNCAAVANPPSPL